MRSYLPSNVRHLSGVLKEVLLSRDAAAYSALGRSVLGILLSPVDIALSPFEQKRYCGAGQPQKPIIFVCGPPRSGTTLMQQVLLQCCPLSYFNNLSAVFPRSPIIANEWFCKFIKKRTIDFQSFYGHTRSLSGPNDGLHLWDRWVGEDRNFFPKHLKDNQSAEHMRRFFAAWQAMSGRGIITKNNRLNGFAHLIHPVLPGALFLCMRRSPIDLAQSLLIARKRITRDLGIPYGAVGAEYSSERIPNDPIADVCRQVRHYELIAAEQEANVGSEHFWVVPYESFCLNPASWMERISARLNITLDYKAVSNLPKLHPSAKNRLKIHELDYMKEILNSMDFPLSDHGLN